MPLPAETIVIDGETYYASQTLNGIESLQRTAVTVYLILDSKESIFEGFILYPNPVKDVLNISNKNNIDKIEIYNIVGQLVNSKALNADHAVVNLQGLAEGIYILKLQSGKAEKVIRIVKE